jgi:hypothetical protein
MSGFSQLQDYYASRLAADEQAGAEAREQAAIEGVTADQVLLRWRQEAARQEAAAAGRPHAGLTLTQQQAAADRVRAIAQAARAQRTQQAQATPFTVWSDTFMARHGRWPNDAECRASGLMPF